MDRLGENFELVSLRASFFEQVRGGGLSGEEQDLASRHPGSGDDGGFDACHTGHDDVADEHVGLEVVESFHRLFSAENCTCFKTGLVQNNCESVCDYLLVVRNEHPRL